MMGYSCVYPDSSLLCVSRIHKGIMNDVLQPCIPRVIITVCMGYSHV